MSHPTTQSLLLAIVAPSGAGKSSLVNGLLAKFPDLQLSISHTTRKPRPNEKEGVNYFFISPEEFLARKATNEFIESAQVYGHYYGTSRHWLQEQLLEEKDILLEIDWQGAAQVKQQFPQMISIFILPPSLASLKQRLTARAQDSEETISQRLATAMGEITHAKNFDYVSINDDFNRCLDELGSIIKASRCRFSQQKRRNPSIFLNYDL